MSWRRGRGTVQVELANVQSKIEDWSDDLDGEVGLIQTIRNEQAERKATLRLIRATVVTGGIVVGIPAFLVSGIELYKLISGR